MRADLEAIINSYKNLKGYEGAAVMAVFLGSVADVLKSEKLFVSKALYTFCISTYSTYPENAQHPGVTVDYHFAEKMFDVDYRESWFDGHFFRHRRDGIRCNFDHARNALIEQIARLSRENKSFP